MWKYNSLWTIVASFHWDVGKGRRTIRLEKGIPHKLPQERRPQQLFQLQSNHTYVSAWESLQKNNIGKNERLNWHMAERSTSWIPSKQIMRWSDCNTTHHSRAILGMELPTLHQLCWLRKGVSTKLVSLIKDSYEGTGCKVIHGGQLTKHFEVKNEVRQGCLLSPFLFLLVINWIIFSCTKQRRNGIQWTLNTYLEDLDFADVQALLSHSHQQMQEKTSELAAIYSRVGLNIHNRKI